MTPDFKDIVGFEGLYAIDRMGQVWSYPKANHKGRLLAPRPNADGYLRVALTSEGKTKDRLVHTLVLETFVGPRPSGCEADHRNKVRSDNRLDNLHWLPKSVNLAQRSLSPKGQKNPNARLTVEDVLELRRQRQELGASFPTLAASFGISKNHARDICQGRKWSHLPT